MHGQYILDAKYVRLKLWGSFSRELFAFGFLAANEMNQLH